MVVIEIADAVAQEIAWRNLQDDSVWQQGWV
jgi:hypothetical protein